MTSGRRLYPSRVEGCLSLPRCLGPVPKLPLRVMWGDGPEDLGRLSPGTLQGEDPCRQWSVGPVTGAEKGKPPEEGEFPHPFNCQRDGCCPVYVYEFLGWVGPPRHWSPFCPCPIGIVLRGRLYDTRLLPGYPPLGESFGLSMWRHMQSPVIRVAPVLHTWLVEAPGIPLRAVPSSSRGLCVRSIGKQPVIPFCSSQV